jgi:hypothetical protein
MGLRIGLWFVAFSLIGGTSDLFSFFNPENAEAKQVVSPNVGSRSPDGMPGRSSSPYGQVPEKREFPNSSPLGDFWTSPGAQIFSGDSKGSSIQPAPCSEITLPDCPALNSNGNSAQENPRANSKDLTNSNSP